MSGGRTEKKTPFLSALCRYTVHQLEEDRFLSFFVITEASVPPLPCLSRWLLDFENFSCLLGYLFICLIIYKI
jgi:hypothetical protein